MDTRDRWEFIEKSETIRQILRWVRDTLEIRDKEDVISILENVKKMLDVLDDDKIIDVLDSFIEDDKFK